VKNKTDSRNSRKSHFPWYFVIEICIEVIGIWKITEPYLLFYDLIRRTISAKKDEQTKGGLMDNSRMTKRNDRCENSHRILIASWKEAAFIYSVTVNFISYVVGPFEFRSVERMQNNEKWFS
jgi:hypothetical protein